jgi:hypothetical protein
MVMYKAHIFLQLFIIEIYNKEQHLNIYQHILTYGYVPKIINYTKFKQILML